MGMIVTLIVSGKLIQRMERREERNQLKRKRERRNESSY
jgi:hypothetical protein